MGLSKAVGLDYEVQRTDPMRVIYGISYWGVGWRAQSAYGYSPRGAPAIGYWSFFFSFLDNQQALT